jgi:class 3 adenylate cyclase
LYRLAKEYQAEHLRWAERERRAVEARRVRRKQRQLRAVQPPVTVRDLTPDRLEAMYGQVEAKNTDAAALPSGFLTMLMTDIESSTDLVEQLGDDYAALLAEIRAILREAILRANGRQIEVHADEFFAVFEHAVDAVKTATEIQRALNKRAQVDKSDVRVRIGIHSGCPTLTEVGYIGVAVHTAARVSAAAHGGQILASGDTITALGEADTSGIRFRSLGRHRMHGLRTEEELFQVEGEGLLTGFPPPRIGGPISSDPWE